MASPTVLERTETAVQFPAVGTDNLVSALVCKLDLNGDGSVTETIVMSSLLRIERSEPYMNANGLRQIDAQLTHWSAKGYSKVLDQKLEYVLSDDKQPMSEIVAQQPEADFPAEVTFRTLFDVKLGGETVISGLHGTAHGTGWMSVPPDGDDFLSVNKDVQLGQTIVVPVECAASQSIKAIKE